MGYVALLRNNLDITPQIFSIIENVKNKFESEEEMVVLQGNGLTAFENKVLDEMLTYRYSKNTSNELKCEIDYYSERYTKAFIAFDGAKNKSLSEKQLYELSEKFKMMYCINTELPEVTNEIKRKNNSGYNI